MNEEYVVVCQYSHPKFKGGINCIDSECLFGRRIIGCTENGFYFGYDTISQKELFLCKPRHNSYLTEISWMKYDTNIFCTASIDGHIRVFDFHSPKSPIRKFNCEMVLRTVSFSYTEPIFYTGISKGLIRVYDLREDMNLQVFKTQHEDEVTVVRCSENNPYLLFAGDTKGRGYLFDLRNYRSIYELDWNRTETLERVSHPRAHDSEIIGACFSKYGTAFTTFDSSGIAREWETDTGLSTLVETRVPSPPRTARNYGIAYAPSCLLPNKNAIFNVDDDFLFVGHAAYVNGICAVGDRFVSYSDDNVVSVWAPSSCVEALIDESDWSE